MQSKWKNSLLTRNRWRYGIAALPLLFLCACGSMEDTDAFLSTVKYDELPQIEAATAKITTFRNGVNRTDANGVDGLMVAAARGRADIVEKLLASGANTRSAAGAGSTALIYAVRKARSMETVDALIRAGADVNAMDSNGNSVAWYALSEWYESDDDNQLIEQIRPPGSSTDELDASELRFPEDARLNDSFLPKPDAGMATVEREFSPRLRLIKRLADAGADLQVANNAGNTLLMRAVLVEDIDAVRFLLANGLDVNAQSGFGMSALSYVGFSLPDHTLNVSIAKELLAAGAHVDATNQDGETALMIAAHRNPDLVKTLLSAHAGLNLKDRDGRSALVKASPESRHILLKAGAQMGDQAALMASWDLNRCAADSIYDRKMHEVILSIGDEFNRLTGKGPSVSAATAIFRFSSSRAECKDLANLRLKGSGADTTASLETEGVRVNFYGVDLVCSTSAEKTIQCRNAKT